MEELPEAQIVAHSGVDGCAHARPGGERQILLVDRETLDAMDLRPGILRENITTEGLDVNGLAIGQELRIGGVRLQVTAVCMPCDQLEKIRPGLRREIRGRRGMLCRVIEGGVVQRGTNIARIS